MDPDIDWSDFINFPENTCYCECGSTYRSHTKLVRKDKFIIFSEKPCPNCRKTEGHLRRVSSDPDTMTLQS